MARFPIPSHRLISWLVAVSTGCLGFWVGNPVRYVEADQNCQSPGVLTVCNDRFRELGWAERCLSSLIFALAGGSMTRLLSYARKRSAQTDSPAAGQIPCSLTDRLSSLTSSPQPLTNRQREVLQCLLVLAAIAPKADDEEFVLSVSKQSSPADARQIIQIFEQGSFQYLTLIEVRQILSTFGFSDWAIQQAWRIICER
ncbi:MAG: hypothetical protein ACFE0J_16235 [Elainellaceae cyanobacterium]